MSRRSQRVVVKTISDKTKTFLDSIDPLDKYGFQIRPQFYWLPESSNNEIHRLEMNLAMYEQFLLNGSRFPEKTNKARLQDFSRLQALKAKRAA